MLVNILNRQLEVGYKSKVVACLPRICINSENSTLFTKITSQLDRMLDYENAEVQTSIGKCLA